MRRLVRASTYYTLKKLAGSRVDAHLKWMRAQQFAPYAELEQQREELLKRLCQHASRNVPWYGPSLGAALRGKGSLAERLRALPPLKREHLESGRDQLISRTVPKGEIELLATGGSTGKPAEIAQNPAYRDWRKAHTLLFDEWMGLTLGEPYFFLWGSEREIRGPWLGRLNMRLLHGRTVLDASRVHPSRLPPEERFRSQIQETSLLRNLQTINAKREVRFLIGYANETYRLACYSRTAGVPARHLRAIATTADNLTPAMRREIEATFGCPVLERYGCRDIGDIAAECGHGAGLHINPLFSHVEVVDDHGQPVPYGETGHLLITSLHNFVMPLIRYEVGDTGILQAAAPCACGRQWETIVQLAGRSSEVLHLGGGRMVRAFMLSRAFERLPGLQRFQIHQESFRRLSVLLRTEHRGYLETHRGLLDQVAAELRAWTCKDMEVRFVESNDFEFGLGGKELLVVHKFDPRAA